jgi:hypothetical protein
MVKSIKKIFPKSIGMIPQGEKCKVRYCQTDPSYAKVESWNFVFSSDEETGLSSAEITRIFWQNWFEPKYGITYTYTTAGVTFTREQDLPPRYQSFFPNLKLGQRYELTYWQQEPERCVINLGKLVE